MSPPRRTALSAALALLAGLLLACGGTLLYVRGEILDGGAFSARVVSTLDDGAVRAIVTRRTVDAIVRGSSGDLLTVRPLATAAVDGVIGSPAFAQAAAQAVDDAHRTLVAGERTVAVRLDRAGALLPDAVRSLSPAVAQRTSPGAAPVLVTVPASDAQLRTIRRLADLAGWAWWLLAGAILAGGAAVAVAADHRTATARLGAAAAGAGALLAAALTLGRAQVTGTAARELWDALLGDLRTAALVVLAGGLVVALIAGGMPERLHSRRAVRRLILAAAGVVAIATLAGALSAGSGAPDAPAAPLAAGAPCNGATALCGVRLNDVVFPGTHNSYAASDEPGWLFPNQRFGIARQLDDGIRALLIDVHFGVRDPASGIVRTDLQADGGSRNKAAQALGAGGLRAADRVAGRIGARPVTGTPELYLCHTLCELGAEPIDQELRLIRRFLDTHRSDVLQVIVEDYVPPRDIERAFERAGLVRYAAVLDRHAPLPTLGELVQENHRLVVFAEEDGGEPAWYMPAFSFIQDTPLAAAGPGNVSCARFRGDADSPILLINHWNIEFPPRPSLNAKINTADALHARVRGCEQAGRPRPGIIAVDFHERSAVVAVARELNARAR
ncbi:MAG TPA: hypothetical protein VII98_01855 [Solirubrobacteraceae bacterium]